MIGPEVQAPDVMEVVVGFRQFGLQRHNQHNYRLVSPHQCEPWPKVEMKAVCRREHPVPDGLVLPGPIKPHPAPQKDCGCGIYAYFDPCPVQYSTRQSAYGGYLLIGGPHAQAYESVEALMTLRGRIEVHSRGMRAEYGRICALGLNEHLNEDEKAALYEIARRFDVPVVSQDDLPALASEYGSVLAESLRPEAPKPDESENEGDANPAPSNPSFVEFGWSEPERSRKRWRGVPLVFDGLAVAANLGLLVMFGHWWSGVAAAICAGFFGRETVAWNREGRPHG